MSKTENDSDFRCVVMGEQSLAVQCGEILLRDGHSIAAFVTDDPGIARWARTHEVRVMPASANLVEELAGDAFDYLFSITNLAIIPDEVLALPSRAAINFHDGPLPRYAGLNAPAWALMNRETSYGVSFHEMRAEIDEGALLEQKSFEISPDETSLTLNTKCFEAGIDAFTALVPKLAAGTAAPVEQDLSAKSYFGRYDRPASAGFLDLRRSAADLEALVRALDFGDRYDNPLAAAKLRVGERVVVVQAAQAVADEPGGAALATGDGTLRVTRVAEVSGEPLALEEVFASDAAAAEVTVLDDETAGQLTELQERLVRNEAFWLRRLARLDPLDLPFAQSRLLEGQTPSFAVREVGVPEAFREKHRERTADFVAAAVAGYLGRISGQERFHVGFRNAELGTLVAGHHAWLAGTVPLRVRQPSETSTGDFFETFEAELARVRKRGTWLRDAIHRSQSLAQNPLLGSGAVASVALEIAPVDAPLAAPAGTEIVFRVSPDGQQVQLHLEEHAVDLSGAESLEKHLGVFLAGLGEADSGDRFCELPLLPEDELQRVLVDWNETRTEVPQDLCIHELIAEQAARTPDAVAAVFEDASLTYRALDERANQLAHHLRERGVERDALVGIYVDRSLDLLVSILGVHKAGGAYVPLDPAYPAERIALMIEDSGAGVVVTQSHREAELPRHRAQVVRVDDDASQIAAHPTTCPESGVAPSNLAYVIYTSGSTGRPKGVMVEHRNVVNFFAGMDACIEHGDPGAWLAVTSLSFDISVLELLWTLARGFKVVVHADAARAQVAVSSQPIDFGLFMWGADDAQGNAKYDLMLESAKFGDENGFSSFWTPERHFHAFGGPYPNPAVTSAAIAAVTKHIGIRAGSCVSPLHHPIRVAEEWAVVDNLSGGRVGVSFAAGWQPNDFVLRPENHKDAKTRMFQDIETVRKLWRGEAVEFENPMGARVATLTQPRPIQAELPHWVTTAGNPDSFRAAGEAGANLLTHLLGQTVEELAEKIALYRKGLKDAGHDPDSGIVTLMLHTLVGDHDEAVKAQAREPMKEYLRSSAMLLKGFAWAFPAFTRPGNGEGALPEIDFDSLSDEEMDAILDFAFERYFETSGLFGSVETCLAQVERVKSIGVDEIGCLIDYGVPTDVMLESLKLLNRVRERANPVARGTSAGSQEGSSGDQADYSLSAQVARHEVTHMQCTPSMARMLVLDPDAHPALRRIEHLMIGGEAFPVSLAHDLDGLAGGRVTNMYGPTETTIWSATMAVSGKPDTICIGSPIANTQLYIVDRNLQPVPVGVEGELMIAGDGVVRGYHERADLTVERFVPDPFSDRDGARMYRTGDLVRWNPDGTVDFRGRMDHQVKIRGYRIELGEIEVRLSEHPGVEACVAIVREDTPGDQRLVAYATAASAEAPDPADLRGHLAENLPEFMIPSAFCFLEALPLTPNGKIDRKALPAPEQLTPRSTAEYQAPENDFERQVAAVWQDVLKLESVGAHDNFFDLGGHSLLVVQVHRQLREQLEKPLSLTDLYRFPTIRSLANHLESDDGGAAAAGAAADRGEKRKAALARRRRRR